MREVTAGREIERGSRRQGPHQAEPARVVSRALGPGRPPRFPAVQPRGQLGHTHRGTQEPPRRGAGTGRRSQAAARRRRRGRGASDRAGRGDHRGGRWRLRGRGSRAASWLIAAPGRAARGRPAGRDAGRHRGRAERSLRPCAHGGAAGRSGSGRVGRVGGSAGSRGSRPDARCSHSEPPGPQLRPPCGGGCSRAEDAARGWEGGMMRVRPLPGAPGPDAEAGAEAAAMRMRLGSALGRVEGGRGRRKQQQDDAASRASPHPGPGGQGRGGGAAGPGDFAEESPPTSHPFPKSSLSHLPSGLRLSARLALSNLHSFVLF